jgi:hypothetical protein
MEEYDAKRRMKSLQNIKQDAIIKSGRNIIKEN